MFFYYRLKLISLQLIRTKSQDLSAKLKEQKLLHSSSTIIYDKIKNGTKYSKKNPHNLELYLVS